MRRGRRQAKLDRTPRFDPVRLRARHDGWTPDRQTEFIEALAACGCVEEASRYVSMTATSAYRLRNRHDAKSFAAAWSAALDVGTKRLDDAAFARALNGVETPIFFQGQQIGVRRRFDERLTQFLLRYRMPEKYGSALDRKLSERPDEAATIVFNLLFNRLSAELEGVSLPDRFMASKSEEGKWVVTHLSSPSDKPDGNRSELAVDRAARHSPARDALATGSVSHD